MEEAILYLRNFLTGAAGLTAMVPAEEMHFIYAELEEANPFVVYSLNMDSFISKDGRNAYSGQVTGYFPTPAQAAQFVDAFIGALELSQEKNIRLQAAAIDHTEDRKYAYSELSINLKN